MAKAAGLLEKRQREEGYRGSEPFPDSLRCSRCTGLMVIEHRFDCLLGTAEAEVSLRRCVQCGEVVDPLILQNRRVQRGHDLSQTSV